MSKPKKKKKKQEKDASRPSELGWIKPWTSEYAVVILFGLILFLRPFVDGLVWPISNSYFAWAMALVFAIWAARTVLSGSTIRVGLPLMLFGIYALIGLATVFSTIRVDLTYAELPILAVSVMALVLGLNVATTESRRRIVFGAILAACICEAFYGIYHVTYVLPQAREAVNSNPALVESVFEGGVMTEDLRHRLESNRAFGTFLFPNAFAGFLVLIVPVAIGSALGAFIAKRDSEDESTAILADSPKQWPRSAKISAIAFFAAVFIGVLLGAEFLVEYAIRGDLSGSSMLRNTFVRYLWSIGGAALLGIVPPIVCAKFGIKHGLTLLTRFAAPVVAAIGAYGVVISGTRGALLGIAVAFAITGFVFLLRRFGARKIATAATAAVILICALAAIMPTDAVAQNDVNVEGRSEDPSNVRFFTIIYRIHYWRVAWSAFMDNMAGGVGLGAYGSAFNKYQYIGAPYAEKVHNDYLQTLVETGLFGGLAFIGFWVFFAIAGARAMLKAKGMATFLAIAGPYTGCMAFALHQFVDFGFLNPSLSMIVFALAGLTMAPIATRELPAGASRMVLIGCLIFAAVAAGWTSRIYVANRAEESLGQRNLRLGGADYLLTFEPPIPSDPYPSSAGAITAFIGKSTLLNEIGYFAVPTGEQRVFREIETTSVVPGNAVFIVRDWEKARSIGRDMSLFWIERYKEIDERYPHRPLLARDIRQLYVRIFRSTKDRAERLACVDESMKWAYAMLDRDPYSGWAMLEVFGAHWMAAVMVEDPEERIDALVASFDHFDATVDLLPAEAFIYYTYSEYLKDVIKRIGDSNPELTAKLEKKRAWTLEQEALVLKTSYFSLTGETHADILRKWPELESTR